MLQREHFLVLLDELLEVPSGSLRGPETLDSLENWNSLAVLGFMAMADEHYGVTLGAPQILACKTVNDLLRAAGAPAA